MLLRILVYPNPILRKKSVDVDAITPEIKQLAEDMAETMYEADGIGLAAPQIGKNIRLVVIDISGKEKQENLITLVNPVVTPYKDAGLSEFEEGCLSIPDFRSNIKRPAKAHVAALDINGESLEFDADGLLATCVQHEVDHLSGKMFIDHMSYLKRSFFEKKWNNRNK